MNKHRRTVMHVYKCLQVQAIIACAELFTVQLAVSCV